MVKTRHGTSIKYTSNDYGRAARAESSRQRKRKAIVASSGTAVASTPPRTRARIEEGEALATPPSIPLAIDTPPMKPSARASRFRMPRCSDYGMLRQFIFKEPPCSAPFFFCHGCDLWDLLPPDHSKKVSPNSSVFRCTAKHQSFSHPTTKVADGYYVKKQRLEMVDFSLESQQFATPKNEKQSKTLSDTDSSDGDHDDDDSSSSSFGSHNTNVDNAFVESDTNFQVVSQKEKEPSISTKSREAVRDNLSSNNQQYYHNEILFLRQQNKSLKQEIKILKKKVPVHDEMKPPKEKNAFDDFFMKKVIQSVESVVLNFKRWSNKRLNDLVVQALWRDDRFALLMKRLLQKYYRQIVFTPFKILREMDLSGGTLSYEGLDVLRRVESQNVKQFRGCNIPSKSSLKRMAAMIENFGRKKCPFQSVGTGTGRESVQFHYGKMVACVTEAFHLDKVGKSVRGLMIASSIDGASLSKNLSIIAGGIKVTDCSALCPMTKRPLLDQSLCHRFNSQSNLAGFTQQLSHLHGYLAKS